MTAKRIITAAKNKNNMHERNGNHEKSRSGKKTGANRYYRHYELPKRVQIYKIELIHVTDIFTQKAGMPLSINNPPLSSEKSL